MSDNENDENYELSNYPRPAPSSRDIPSTPPRAHDSSPTRRLMAQSSTMFGEGTPQGEPSTTPSGNTRGQANIDIEASAANMPIPIVLGPEDVQHFVKLSTVPKTLAAMFKCIVLALWNSLVPSKENAVFWLIAIGFAFFGTLAGWQIAAHFGEPLDSSSISRADTWFKALFSLVVNSLTTYVFVVSISTTAQLLRSFELTTLASIVTRITVAPQCAVILALDYGRDKHHVQSFDNIRAAITSEIAGSIFLVLLLQVGFAQIVATWASVPESASHHEHHEHDEHDEQRKTNFTIALVIAILFFAIDAAVAERRSAAFIIGTIILWLALVIDLYAMILACRANIQRETDLAKRWRDSRNDQAPRVTAHQKFWAFTLTLVVLGLATTCNYFSAVLTIDSIERITALDHNIPAAFLELIILPLASGAAEFRLVYRLASAGHLSELLADLSQVLKFRLVYSFLFAQMVSLISGQMYTPGFTTAAAAIFFGVMFVAVFIIENRVKPLHEFALLFLILFLVVGIITFTNGEIVMSLTPLMPGGPDGSGGSGHVA